VRFSPAYAVCVVCGQHLGVWKTQTRSVVSLAYGCFQAQEVILSCPAGCLSPEDGESVRRYRSEALAQIVAPAHRYAFDVVAEVGILRFLQCRQRLEIQAEIKKRYGVFIPEGTIQELMGRFIDALCALHEEKVPVLRQSLVGRGGYVLYLDGTCEEGSKIHFACLTDSPPVALWSATIDSESAVQIRRVLKEVDKRFGRPAATMEDLSNAIRNAVHAQWPGLPIFYCHQHFLADVGKDLLGDRYRRVRALVYHSKIRPELRRFLKQVRKTLGDNHEEARWICQHLDRSEDLKEKGRSLKATSIAGGIAEWVLGAPSEGTGRGFPYDLPHVSFCLRARKALQVLDTYVVPRIVGRTPRGEKLLLRLRRILHCFLASPTLPETVNEIREVNSVFLRLRNALRLAAQGSARGMNGDPSSTSPEEVRAMEETVIRLREELRREHQRTLSAPLRTSIEIVLRHLDQYWDGLFGHCLPVSSPEERYLMVQRTNNLSERFFRRVKRFQRRVTGKKRLNREVDALPPQALLVFNLATPGYVELLCGSLANLPRAFAALSRATRFPTPSTARRTATFLDRKTRRNPHFARAVAVAYAAG